MHLFVVVLFFIFCLGGCLPYFFIIFFEGAGGGAFTIWYKPPGQVTIVNTQGS